MYSRILVPLDDSHLAADRLPTAFALATQAEGEVLMVRALVPERVLVPDALSGYGLLWPDRPQGAPRPQSLPALTAPAPRARWGFGSTGSVAGT